jgi:hypothetical protein
MPPVVSARFVICREQPSARRRDVAKYRNRTKRPALRRLCRPLPS